MVYNTQDYWVNPVILTVEGVRETTAEENMDLRVRQ
jgi:hypothetical protein